MSTRPGSERVTLEVGQGSAPPPPPGAPPCEGDSCPYLPPPPPKPDANPNDPESNPNDAQAQLMPLLLVSSHSIHLHGAHRRDYVDTCNDDKIVWSEPQNATMVISIGVQLAVLAFSIVALAIGLNRDEQPPEGLRTVAWLETAVQLVELTWGVRADPRARPRRPARVRVGSSGPPRRRAVRRTGT